MIDLTDMNILVTGGSRGIGRAIVEGLSCAGAMVGIHCNKNLQAAESVLKKIGGKGRIFQGNLDDPAETFKLFEDVESAFGKIHVLVNNAGIYLRSSLDDSKEQWLESWNHTLQVNLTATGILCMMGVKHFLKNNGGRIINIASRAAFRGDDPDYMAYAASKGGMVSLTRTIARGFGKQGVRAFTIAPGFVRTDMAQSYFDLHGEEGVLKDIALEQLTEPDDVANIAVFLASGLADHATGTSIDVNAGSYVR